MTLRSSEAFKHALQYDRLISLGILCTVDERNHSEPFAASMISAS
jgi:hypothetical protein